MATVRASARQAKALALALTKWSCLPNLAGKKRGLVAVLAHELRIDAVLQMDSLVHSTT
jgi:hypothetical protein